MAFKFEDRVRDTTTGTSTGARTVTGSAPTGYRTFSVVCSVGDKFPGFIAHQSANEWEVGIYTYSASNQVTVFKVIASSNAGSAVSFSAGTKDVVMDLISRGTKERLEYDVDANGAAGDGSTDDYAVIQACIDAAQANGAGKVTLNRKTYAISATLVNNTSNVVLEGLGADNPHDGGGGYSATKLLWTGGASPMVKWATKYLGAGGNGSVIAACGVRGIQFQGAATATYGLLVDSVRFSTFENLYVTEVVTAAYRSICGVSSTDTSEAADSRNNVWRNCRFRLTDSVGVRGAHGFDINGASNANTCFTLFENCSGQHWNGNAFNIVNADNVTFLLCDHTNSGGTGYGFDNKADSFNNFFIGCSWGNTQGFIVRTPSGGGPVNGGAVNQIITFDRGNSASPPELEAGAGIISPFWIGTSPAVTADSGSITTKTITVYITRMGKTAHLFGELDITNVGTATGNLNIALPVESEHPGPIGGFWNRSTGEVFNACYLPQTDNLALDFGGVAIANDTYNFSVTYEAAD